MKKLLGFLFVSIFIQSILVCQAQENCNPDPNKLITGVPYCDDLNINTTKTENPDEINNAVDYQSNTTNSMPEAIIVDPYRYNPGITPGVIPPNIGPLYEPDYNPPVNMYSGTPLHMAPNTPNDLRPLEIPNSGTIQPGDLPPNPYLY
ncbi:MAG: hypothetical protein AB1782_12895 [Cyanobacteriota bacterium]